MSCRKQNTSLFDKWHRKLQKTFKLERKDEQDKDVIDKRNEDPLMSHETVYL